MQLVKSSVFLASLPAALADWQYLSRPDLSPPRLNITVPASSSVSSGYIFITPYAGFELDAAGPEQPGAYIFRNNGDLIWSGIGYLSGLVADFRPTITDGKPVLGAFQGRFDGPHGRTHGHHAVLDDHYETLKTVRAASHHLTSLHEFQVVDGRSVLIEVPVPVPFDLSAYGGEKDQAWILSSGFQEIDLHTGELLFEWYSLDHIDPQYSAHPLEPTGPFNARTSFDAWDYFHLNSADKDPEGNYIISARNYAAIFKINGTTGDVIWQLGGLQGSDLRFRRKPSSRFNTMPDSGIAPTTARLNASLFSTMQTREYAVLAEWECLRELGPGGAVTEFSEAGDVLFHAYLDTYPNQHVQSYRGFRFPWTGFSSEEPAVLALGDAAGQVSVYVSWNGDTETDVWHFHLLDGKQRRYLGEKKRTSFETAFQADLRALSVQNLRRMFIVAEARDAKGDILGQSRVTGLSDSAPYPSSRVRSEEDDQQRLEL